MTGNPRCSVLRRLCLGGFLLCGLALLAPPAAAAAPVEATVRLHPTRAVGLDPEGRLRIYAPSFPVGGNPASHWDPWAFPDLLMEPAVTPGREVADVDLTLPALEDLGWSRGDASIQLRFEDAPGEGFHHPELGEARRRAMRFAAEVWSGLLASEVKIEAAVSFVPLVCAPNAGVLAQADTSFLFEDFPGAPRADTWYPGALAEALSGVDLSAQDPERRGEADLFIEFNTRIDEECIFPGAGFYYGLDSELPPGKFSFVATALHELAHGLGFGSRVDRKTGEGFEGLPDAYSVHLFDRTFDRSWPELTPRERQQSQGNSGNLVWTGREVTAAARERLMPAAQVLLDLPPDPSQTSGDVLDLLAAPALFGPPLDRPGLTGELALAMDSNPRPTLACGPVENAAFLAGRIAVVDRGVCTFAEKASAVQEAGAVAVLILDSEPGPPDVIGGGAGDVSAGVEIPVALVESAGGQVLRRALVENGPPFPPRELSLTLGFGGSVILRWRDASGHEERFVIERRVGGGPFQRLDQVAANKTSYSDRGLEDGVTYTYRVRAENAAGPSPFTAPASFTLPDSAPPPPRDLEARTESSRSVLLSWRPLPILAEAILVDRRAVALRDSDGRLVPLDPNRSVARFHELRSLVGTTTEGRIGNLTPGALLDFRVRARNNGGTSEPSNVASATLPLTGTEPLDCTPDATTLCLLDGRFRVEALFRDRNGPGEVRNARAVPDRRREVPGGPASTTEETGFFWFFRPDNLELVVKMLDATSFADARWFFYGALSDVEYWIVVTDTESGAVRTYHNPSGRICGRADTTAFPEPVSGSATSVPAGGSSPPTARVETPASLGLQPAGSGISGTCAEDGDTLCLLDGRFAVRVDWRDLRSADEGVGTPIPAEAVSGEGGDGTGFFWFFDDDNLELVTKVIDGTGVNGSFWFFYGALTDVQYDIEVVDTVSGHRAVFTNPMGNVCGDGRTDVFPGP